MTAAVLLVHLVCFAAYLGAGFGQLQLMKRSRTASGETRKTLEELAAAVVTKIELPAIFGSMASGAVFIAQSPVLMKQGWLHGKLLCVVLLVVLSHVEMINARKIVKARAAKGDAANDEIDGRKKRHELYGALGSVLVVILLVLVTFVRLG